METKVENNIRQDGLPSNVEAEMAVLGACYLGSKETVSVVVTILKREHFYRDAHKLIFDAIFMISHNNEPVDIITLQNQMSKNGTLEGVGLEYLYILGDVEFTTSNVEYYAKIVRDKAKLRAVVEKCLFFALLAQKTDRDADSVVDELVNSTIGISRNFINGSFHDSNSVVRETALWLNSLESDGIRLGIKTLDKLTTGAHPSELIYVAGKSGTGKTAFMCQWILMAARAGKRCLLVTAEMPKRQLCARMAYSIARVDGQQVRDEGFFSLSVDERARVGDALREIRQLPITWIDNVGEQCSVSQIISTASMLKAQDGLDVVAVDYIQIIDPPPGRYEGERQQIEAVSKGLMRLSTRLDIAVIGLSQFSGEGELRGSRALDADPATIIRLYDKESTTGDFSIVTADVTKQRNGQTGYVDIAFHKKHGYFTPISY